MNMSEKWVGPVMTDLNVKLNAVDIPVCARGFNKIRYAPHSGCRHILDRTVFEEDSDRVVPAVF
jgi:hypothetical protein